jgi:hypothetical protein
MLVSGRAKSSSRAIGLTTIGGESRMKEVWGGKHKFRRALDPSASLGSYPDRITFLLFSFFIFPRRAEETLDGSWMEEISRSRLRDQLRRSSVDIIVYPRPERYDPLREWRTISSIAIVSCNFLIASRIGRVRSAVSLHLKFKRQSRPHERRTRYRPTLGEMISKRIQFYLSHCREETRAMLVTNVASGMRVYVS